MTILSLDAKESSADIIALNDCKIKGISSAPITHDDFDFENDVVLVPFSSGTTGLPKGVQLTHQNVVTNIHQLSSQYFEYMRMPTGKK